MPDKDLLPSGNYLTPELEKSLEMTVSDIYAGIETDKTEAQMKQLIRELIMSGDFVIYSAGSFGSESQILYTPYQGITEARMKIRQLRHLLRDLMGYVDPGPICGGCTAEQCEGANCILQRVDRETDVIAMIADDTPDWNAKKNMDD